MEEYKQQAIHYEALFEAVRGEEDWFMGAFWWNWNTDDGDTGLYDDFLSPQWKPAEDVLRKYYRATAKKPTRPTWPAMCMGKGNGIC